MSLKDFIAKQPMNIIVRTEIEDNKVILPVSIDTKAFYKDFSNEINSEGLTPEKAIFIATQNLENNKMKTSIDLLNSRLKF